MYPADQDKPAPLSIAPKRRLNGHLVVAATAIVLVLGVAGGGAWWRLYHQADPFPPAVKTVDFSLYYPTASKLPPGFSIDSRSFEKSHGVVTYTLTYDTDKKLVFTNQPKPQGFDFDGLQSDAKKLHSSIGDAYAGAIGERTVVSIPTADSWLLIGIPSPIDTSKLQVILNNLQVVEPRKP